MYTYHALSCCIHTDNPVIEKYIDHGIHDEPDRTSGRMPPNVEFETFPDDAESKVHEYVPSGVNMLPKMTGRE